MRISVLIAAYSLILIGCNHSTSTLEDYLASYDEVKWLPSGVLTTDSIEFNTSWSEEYQEIYFSSSFNSKNGPVIKMSKLVNGNFTIPQEVKMPDNYKGAGDVHINSDGKKLYFSNGEIAYMERTDTGWDNLTVLPETINTDSYETYPVVTNSGNIYFGRYSEEYHFDIYVSKYVNETYQKAIKLSENINSDLLELDAFVAPDESYMIFTVKDVPNGFGVTDLHISFNNNGEWSPRKIIGKDINSTGVDGSPFVTKNSKYILFTSNRDSDEPSVFDGRLDLYAGPINIDSYRD